MTVNSKHTKHIQSNHILTTKSSGVLQRQLDGVEKVFAVKDGLLLTEVIV
jgi:hypothetical protein